MRLKNTTLQPNVFTNWNEKGFVIGMTAVTKRIMSKKAYESGRITGASQGGIESLSVYLLVCQLLESLSPPLCYTKENQETFRMVGYKIYKLENAHTLVHKRKWTRC